MPGVFIGSSEIVDVGKIKVGSTDVQEVYVGSAKIWPSGAPPGPIPILDFNPGAGDPLPGTSTFTRNSVALQFNGTQFVQVANDVIRDADFDRAGGPRAALLENASTNNIHRSSEFDDPYWTATGLIVTDLGVGAIGLNEYSLDAGTSTGLHRLFRTVGSGQASAYAIAKEGPNDGRYMIVRKGGGTQSYACFDLRTGTVTEEGTAIDSAPIKDLGNGYYQCMVITTDTNSAFQVAISNTPTPGNVDFNFTGANETIFLNHCQWEAARPTSPIVTNGGPVTRQDDVLTDVAWPVESSAIIDVEVNQFLRSVAGPDEDINSLGFGALNSAAFGLTDPDELSLINSTLSVSLTAASSYAGERHGFGMSLKTNEGIIVDDENNDNTTLTGTPVQGAIQIGLNALEQGLGSRYFRVRVFDETQTVEELKAFL